MLNLPDEIIVNIFIFFDPFKNRYNLLLNKNYQNILNSNIYYYNISIYFKHINSNYQKSRFIIESFLKMKNFNCLTCGEKIFENYTMLLSPCLNSYIQGKLKIPILYPLYHSNCIKKYKILNKHNDKIYNCPLCINLNKYDGKDTKELDEKKNLTLGIKGKILI